VLGLKNVYGEVATTSAIAKGLSRFSAESLLNYLIRLNNLEQGELHSTSWDAVLQFISPLYIEKVRDFGRQHKTNPRILSKVTISNAIKFSLIYGHGSDQFQPEEHRYEIGKIFLTINDLIDELTVIEPEDSDLIRLNSSSIHLVARQYLENRPNVLAYIARYFYLLMGSQNEDTASTQISRSRVESSFYARYKIRLETAFAVIISVCLINENYTLERVHLLPGITI
jgi:hypothetical protein